MSPKGLCQIITLPLEDNGVPLGISSIFSLIFALSFLANF